MKKAFLMQDDSKLRTVFMPYKFLDADQQKKIYVPGMNLATAGQSILLSTADAQKLQLGEAHFSAKQVTSACHGIRTTQISPITPVPSWYGGLQENFDAAQKLANEWLLNYSIAVTSQIPASITGFTSLFDAAAGTIKSICDRSPGELSKDDLSTVKDIFRLLIDKSDKSYKEVAAFATTEGTGSSGILPKWQGEMSDVRCALSKGNTSIQNAESSMASEIQVYNSNIEKLQAEIAEYNKQVALGNGLMIAGGVIASIGSLVLVFFPIAGAITIALGVLVIAGGTATWAYYQKQINDASRNIVGFMNSIEERKRTITALKGLESNVNLVLTNADNAIKRIGSFAETWANFSLNIKSTLEALQEGNECSTGTFIKIYTQAALNDWVAVNQYAQDLLNGRTEPEKVPAGELPDAIAA